MDFRDFLEQVHERLAPPTYLEIGVRHGRSLALARCTSVGIDPAPDLSVELAPHVSLFQETSDDYFRRPDPLASFGGQPISLAMIDGMHLVEYVLRDFINVERNCRWTSAVVIDDVLPRRPIEATRERSTRFWTGDVYKIHRILARLRPDLVCLRVGTSPTGMLLILGLDPANSALADRYERIARRAASRHRRRVPKRALEHRDVLAPGAVLAASFWSVLRDLRAQDAPREQGLARLRATLQRDLEDLRAA